MEHIDQISIERAAAMKPKELILMINLMCSSGNVQFKTPVTELLLIQLVDWLNCAANGASVLGWFRRGKTCGCRWALKALSVYLGMKIPYIEIPKRNNNKREKAKQCDDFFDYLLNCTGHIHGVIKGIENKRNRISGYLTDRAKTSPLQTVILYFDEGSELTVEELLWIRDIGNELDKEGVRLFVLISGSDALLERRAQLIRMGEEQLVARYLGKIYKYRGLISVDEVHACVQNIFSLESRPKNGCSANALFKGRGGLEIDTLGLATDLWRSFGEKWMEAGLGDELELSMKYFCEAIAWIFNESNKRDWKVIPTLEDVRAAVAKSSFDVAIDIRLAQRKASEGRTQ